jgi:hypothetical protein
MFAELEARGVRFDFTSWPVASEVAR